MILRVCLICNYSFTMQCSPPTVLCGENIDKLVSCVKLMIIRPTCLESCFLLSKQNTLQMYTYSYQFLPPPILQNINIVN